MADRAGEQAHFSMTITPVVAALTTLCASTALAGVVEGARWLGYAGVAVTVVTAVGLGLRAVRTPTLLVGLAQMFALFCLVVALFTNNGVLGFLPGPQSVAELGDVLRNSVETVRNGVPPVGASTPVLCLVVIAIGLVAVLVDTLSVSAGTPAACGLVLLCVYAVPASLSDELLPWWSFVLGAGSFAVLLAVDGAHRHQRWRNRPALPTSRSAFGSPVAMVGSALVMGLLAGALITGVGTVGSIPGGGRAGGGGGGLALKPFTALRGMLDQGQNVELFRIRGLGKEGRYLRAMTLPRYDRNGGWQAADALPMDTTVRGELPPGPGDDGGSLTTRVEIEPVNSEDLWVPVYGIPRLLRDLPDDLYYDRSGGMVYSKNVRKMPKYVEEADMSQPAADELRSGGADFSDLDPTYLVAEGIDPEVVKLARDLTKDKPTLFDKAMALKAYFDRSNGFEYKTRTGQSSDEDALKEFLFRSKIGFCEQYASAMALLARAAGIPSRVAIGYTGGFQNGDYRSITTQDAHAWVEVFFPDHGWISFDPTPLTDGRAYQPPYASDSTQPTDSAPTPEEEKLPRTNPTDAPPSAQQPPEQPNAGGGDQVDGDQGGSWPWEVWTAIAAALIALAGLGLSHVNRFGLPIAAGAGAVAVVFLLALLSWVLVVVVALLVVAATPALIRAWRRREHHRAVHQTTPDAATAAWTELMAESLDRGTGPSETETVRATARRLAREHAMDDGGKQALKTVVDSVERSWYGGRSDHDPELARAFEEVVRGLRRTAPLALRARLLPRSVLRPRQRD